MGMMEWKAMLREIHSSQCAGMGHKCVSRERIKEVGMRFWSIRKGRKEGRK